MPNRRFAVLIVLAALLAPLLPTLAPPSTAAQGPTPRFGNHMILIRAPQQTPGYPVAMSADGRYALAVGQNNDGDEAGLWLNLWRLDQYALGAEDDALAEPIAPPPDAAIRLEDVILTDDPPIITAIAAAPDGRHVALITPGGQYLLSLPALEVVQALSRPNSDAITPAESLLAWSPDGRWVAGMRFDSGAVMLIDTEDDELFTSDQPLLELPHIRWVNDAWLLSGGQDATPQVCDAIFSLCQDAPFAEYGRFVSATDDGARILTRDLVEGRRVDWLLTRGADGQYSAEQLPIAAREPLALSPSGSQLATETALLALPGYEVLNQPEAYRAFANGVFWLPDSDEQIVVGLMEAGFLLLHRVGQPEVLDSRDIPSTRVRPDFVGDFIDFGRFEASAVSDAGNQVLVNLGRAALIVPVIYE